MTRARKTALVRTPEGFASPDGTVRVLYLPTSPGWAWHAVHSDGRKVACRYQAEAKALALSWYNP